MIYGIGTDIVSVPRMRRNIERFGDRFAGRILDTAELADYRRSARPAHFLAKRFAAKEAAVKAMGLGFREGVGLRDIAVTHDSRGRPLLRFGGAAATFVREHGIVESHLSVADEAEHAIAFVTLLRAGS